MTKEIKKAQELSRRAREIIEQAIKESHEKRGEKDCAAYRRTRDLELNVIDECF